MKNKICCKCKIEKDIGGFSLKSRKGESVLRYDPKCKDCKKAERKKITSIAHGDEVVEHQQEISNLALLERPIRKVSKESLDSIFGADDLGLNTSYANNFNEFIQILRDEYARIIGVQGVYIKKTK